MIVMKFGGTSVGSAKRMEQVLEIISAQSKENTPLVVLSAMSGVTNLLIEGAELALSQRLDDALKLLSELRQRHTETLTSLIDSGRAVEDIQEKLTLVMAELEVLYKGVSYLGELTMRSLDAIAGSGELMSSLILSGLAVNRGHDSIWVDARKVLVTNNNFGQAQPNWHETEKRARILICPPLAGGKLVFTQGFIGATESGITTTLGRGGSDYSASIFGVSIGAEEIQIWTDVDGMLTADPRIVSEARLLPEVSFKEASELAYFGAKVLHPLTIRPAIEKNIPVKILNTLNPDASGTLITSSANGPEIIRAIASKKKITAVYLHSPNMLMTHGFLAEVFAVFRDLKIPVDLISTSEVSVAITIDNTQQLSQLRNELSKFGEIQILENAAIISVVGRQFREQSGIAARVFKALSNINVLMISGGASDINLSFVVSEEQADQAIRQLHDEFFHTQN